MNAIASARPIGRTRIETAPTPSVASSAESQPGSTWAGQRRDGMSAVATVSPEISPGSMR